MEGGSVERDTLHQNTLQIYAVGHNWVLELSTWIVYFCQNENMISYLPKLTQSIKTQHTLGASEFWPSKMCNWEPVSSRKYSTNWKYTSSVSENFITVNHPSPLPPHPSPLPSPLNISERAATCIRYHQSMVGKKNWVTYDTCGHMTLNDSIYTWAHGCMECTLGGVQASGLSYQTALRHCTLIYVIGTHFNLLPPSTPPWWGLWVGSPPYYTAFWREDVPRDWWSLSTQSQSHKLLSCWTSPHDTVVRPGPPLCGLFSIHKLLHKRSNSAFWNSPHTLSECQYYS